MKIVERKKPSLSSLTNQLTAKDGDEGTMEVEIRELVDVIHAAAADPDIVALYGTFGHGFGFQCGGYAHVEEVRNAIRVFNESHRRHYDYVYQGKGDNSKYPDGICELKEKDAPPMQKLSYAFADTFDNPSDPGNKEYFLASAFSQVHMQPRGNMNLFGVSISNFFLADAFNKYGIKAHVFKHGKYKTAPNTATESGYTKAHLENTTSILDSINGTVYALISQSRALAPVFDKSAWKDIHDFGTMTADNAQEIKLVDYLPQVNPLFDLVNMNKIKEKSESLREKWGALLKEDGFRADELLSLPQYSARLRKKKKWQTRKGQMYEKFTNAAARSSALETVLGALGYESPYFHWDKKEVDEVFSKMTKDKVAVIHVTGGIDDKVAKTVTRALREVKKDANVKCVVLRVDSPGGSVTASETVLEECKDIGIPVVCSFSNLAASGGYYVSAFSDRIFAQRTTLTGSIGVFGVKLDAVEAARRHGIEFDSVTSGSHAQTYSLFHPLTHDMKINLSRNMDRVYQYFKQLVSEGRNMPMSEVEEVAQGRVWTGEQAKENNLVDEFGGIHRAIAYATAKYTSGSAEVVVFPKEISLKERLMKTSQKMEIAQTQGVFSDDYVQLLLNGALNGSASRLVTPCSVVICMDEASTMQTIIREACHRVQGNP